MSQPIAIVLLTTTLLIGASSTTSAQAPSCDSAHLGTVACFVRKLCACTLSRGGAMTGLPTGYRWDCGPLRPGCGADTLLPATIDPYLGGLPPALSLDRNQTIINTQTGAGSRNQTVTGDRSAGSIVIRPTPPAAP
jgi:hypothetical protein